MELYTGAREFDPNTLVNLCVERRNVPQDWFFLVVFDSPEHAKFPSNPFTADYGMDWDTMRHIIAHYTYRRSNSYNTLNIYPTNSYESSPTVLHP